MLTSATIRHTLDAEPATIFSVLCCSCMEWLHQVACEGSLVQHRHGIPFSGPLPQPPPKPLVPPSAPRPALPHTQDLPVLRYAGSAVSQTNTTLRDVMLCVTTGTGLPALVMMPALCWASSRLGSMLWQQNQGEKKTASGVELLTLTPAQKLVTCRRSWLAILQRLLLQICMGKPSGPADTLILPL